MSRNGIAVVDWKTWGPRVLAWLAAEAPRRTTVNGLAADCAAALGPPLRAGRLQDWLAESARAAWSEIKRTLGSANGNGSRLEVSEKSAAPPVGLTILEYDRQQEVAEDRARCPVCKLPPAPREEIAEAKRAGLNATRILRSLACVHNITITPHDWAHHINARHET